LGRCKGGRLIGGRNAGVPEDRRIVFRVGIHLGDVVEESDGHLNGRWRQYHRAARRDRGAGRRLFIAGGTRILASKFWAPVTSGRNADHKADLKRADELLS
jgi:hypothetical protein